MNEEVLWPKPRRRKNKSNRTWRVEYSLAFDGGGSEWESYYRTRIGAKIAAWYNVHISSWGGKAVLIKNRQTGSFDDPNDGLPMK